MMTIAQTEAIETSESTVSCDDQTLLTWFSLCSFVMEEKRFVTLFWGWTEIDTFLTQNQSQVVNVRSLHDHAHRSI